MNLRRRRAEPEPVVDLDEPPVRLSTEDLLAVLEAPAPALPLDLVEA